MKKFLFLAIAVAAMASCSQDEVLEVAEKEAINFGLPFIENSTRAAASDPTYSGTGELTAFQVWGTVNSTTNAAVEVFKDVNVTGVVGANSVWNTAEADKQYWIYGATYNFAAVVNADVDASGKSAVTCNTTNLLPETITYTADNTNTKDLLYATAPNIVRAKDDSDKKVPMQFAHLLSKVKFSAVNTTVDTRYTFDIKNITITNSPASGTYYVQTVGTNTAGTWSTTSGGTTTFGAIDGVVYTTDATVKNECPTEKLLIPAKYETGSELVVTYDLVWKFNGNEITTTVGKTPITSKAVVNFQAGYAYNLKIQTGLDEPIQFTVTQDPTWTTAPDQPVTVQ